MPCPGQCVSMGWLGPEELYAGIFSAICITTSPIKVDSMPEWDSPLVFSFTPALVFFLLTASVLLDPHCQIPLICQNVATVSLDSMGIPQPWVQIVFVFIQIQILKGHMCYFSTSYSLTPAPYQCLHMGKWHVSMFSDYKVKMKGPNEGFSVTSQCRVKSFFFLH